MPQIPSLRRWLVPVAVLLAAVRCGGGDSLTLPSEILPAHITLEAGDGQTGTAGVRLTDTLAVRITNSKNEAVPTVKVVFQLLAGGTGGDLIPDTAVTDMDGQAKSVWVLGRLAGPQSVQARVIGQVAGPPLNVTIRATAVAGAPDTVFAALGDLQSGAVGSTLTDSLAVLVTDQYANPVAGQTVNWTVPAGQGSVSAASGVTGLDGRAAVTRRLGPTTGTQTAAAAVGSVAGSPVTFTATATAGGAVRAVKLFGDNQTAPVAFQLTDSIVVQVQDANGNGVPGRTVNWVVTDGGSVTPLTSSTDAQGKAFAYWTLKPSAGANQLTAAAAGLAQLQFSATGTSATPAHLVAQSSTSIAGTAGLNVAQPPSVKVTDANGNPVQGATITFLVTAGGGSVSDGTGNGASASVATNASGVATLTSWTLGQVAGIANTVTATAAGTGISGNPVTFSASAAAGAATRLRITTQPSANAQSGVVLGQQPVVQLRDVFGNAVPQANVQVTASVLGAGATLRGTPTVSTSAGGIATFSGLNLVGATGAYTLRFAASGLTPDTSSAITLAAGAAAKLVLTTQPSASAQSGVAFGTQPVLQVQDSAGNPVPVSGIQVAAAIASGGGSLGGTTSVSTVGNGSAAYTNLSISGAPGARTLSFTASGLTTAVSGTVTLGAGVPTQLGVVTQPSASAQNGSVLVQQPVIELRDATGNTVPLAGVSVTATITGAPGGVGLGGSATVVTTASGTASFAGLSLTGPAGNYTLTFTVTAGASGVAPVTSSAISLTAGPATQLSFTTPTPANASSGAAFSPAPVLQLRDGAGNAVTSSGIGITAAIANGPSGGNLGNAIATTVNGAATFTGLTLTGTAGSYTLNFAGTGLTPITSPTIALSAGGGTQLGITTQPSASVANGQQFPQQPVIQLQDGIGNPVNTAGVSVTVSIQSGGGTLAGTTTVLTNGNGVAAFTNLSLTGATGIHTLLFAASGVTSVTSGNISLTAGAPSSISITTQPSTTAQNTVAFGTQPVAVVRDQGNNVVPGTGVTASIATGNGTLGGNLSVTTDGAGVATFGTLAITGPVGARTLQLTAGAASAITNSITITPGPVSGGQSTATVPNGTVGLSTPISVVAKDVSGNPVGVGGATVTISVSGNNSAVPTVTDNGNGTYSASYTPAVAGSDNVAILVNSSPVSGSPFASTVAGGSSTTSISLVNPSSSVVGQAYTVSVSVAGAGVTPTGTVTVSDGTGATCPATLSSGAGSCQITSTTAGAKSLVASYAGDANYGGSTSGTTAHTVGAAATTTGVTTNPTSTTSGSSYTVNFTVAAVAPGAGTPTGTVNVSDGVGGTCSGALTSGAGSCQLSTGSVGSQTITATYAGTTDFSGSSNTVTHTVTVLGSTTTITSNSPNPSVVGQSVTVSVSVTSVIGTPSGTVAITDGATPFCTATLSGGTGSCSAAFGSAGARTLTATYSGDGTHGGSSNTAPQQVDPFGAATQLAFTVQPSMTKAGLIITPAVEVSVLDQFGNLVTTATDAITLTIAIDGSGAGATLTGTIPVNAIGGVATFSDLSIDLSGNGYQLKAAATGLADGFSALFHIN